MGARKKKRRAATGRILAACLLVIAVFWVIMRNNMPSTESGTLDIIDERIADSDEPMQYLTETQPSAINGYDLYEKSSAIIPDGYTILKKESTGIYEGLLLDVDFLYPFTGTASNLTTFDNQNISFRVRNADLLIMDSALLAMNELMIAYEEETGKKDLLVYSTTEACQTEGSLYPQSMPDSGIGSCLDLAFLNDDGTISPMTSENNTWLLENAWRFGFFFSIPDCDWHIRYIGKVHTAIMQELELNFDQYLVKLRSYSVTNPYVYHASAFLYFVRASSSDSTEIPVPKEQDYLISGNNVDGYFVTVTAD